MSITGRCRGAFGAVVRGTGGGPKRMGEPTGVARQAVKPPIETLSGTIKDIKVGPAGDTAFELRDENLRPNWAIAARGGRDGGPGMGAGRGPGQGRGPWRWRMLLVTGDAG